MRIFHFVQSLDADTGGPSRTVPRLAQAQAALGHTVEVGVVEHDRSRISSEAAALLASNVKVTFFESMGKLPDRVKTAEVVNVHGIWNLANHAACSATSDAGVPLVVSPRGMLEPWALRNKPFKKQIGWWTYQRRDLQRADALHATSEQERANMSRLRLRAPVTVVPNGVDAPPASARSDVLPPRSLLFLSRIDRKKGIPMLIEAAAEIAAPMRDSGWRIFIVGPSEPSYVAELRRLMQTRNVADLFEFRPAVDGVEKWSLLKSAEVMVLPTYSENFGLVIAEALASGTPVLTTTGTPWCDLQTLQCGWWVEPKSAALVDALREAINLTGEQRRAMGSRGAALVRERFDWPHVAEAMIELYRDVIH
jgi:glycosyltransferase involved in cell wall biosynthesis